MKMTGMSLVELLVGLAVAGIVAAIAITSLSMVGLRVVRQRVAVRADEAVWMAQAAIAHDLRKSKHWAGCVEALGCSNHAAYEGTPALVLDGAEWLAADGLRRCSDKRCDVYLDGIVGVEFVADIPVAEGIVRRAWFAEADDDAIALEVVLWTRDGQRYSRTTGKDERAP